MPKVMTYAIPDFQFVFMKWYTFAYRIDVHSVQLVHDLIDTVALIDPEVVRVADWLTEITNKHCVVTREYTRSMLVDREGKELTYSWFDKRYTAQLGFKETDTRPLWSVNVAGDLTAQEIAELVKTPIKPHRFTHIHNGK